MGLGLPRLVFSYVSKVFLPVFWLSFLTIKYKPFNSAMHCDKKSWQSDALDKEGLASSTCNVFRKLPSAIMPFAVFQEISL